MSKNTEAEKTGSREQHQCRDKSSYKKEPWDVKITHLTTMFLSVAVYTAFYHLE